MCGFIASKWNLQNDILTGKLQFQQIQTPLSFCPPGVRGMSPKMAFNYTRRTAYRSWNKLQKKFPWMPVPGHIISKFSTLNLHPARIKGKSQVTAGKCNLETYLR